MKFTTERPYFWLFASLALVGLVADQASKYIVFANLYPADNAWDTRAVIIPGNFELRTAYKNEIDTGDKPLSFLRTISGERQPFVNHGALFGFGNGNDDDGAQGFWASVGRFFRYLLKFCEDSDHSLNTLFMVISGAAIVFVVLWAARPIVARDRWLCLALGLILAGTLGNLYDRIVFSGVRDFLHCYYEQHIWPDFNIADCCLVCGAGILMVHSFFAKDPAAEPAKTESVPAAAPMQATAPTSGA